MLRLPIRGRMMWGRRCSLRHRAGTVYAWKGPNGFTSGVASPSIPNATTANAGSYSVTVSTGSACPAVGAVTTAIVRGALLPPVISASQTTVCAGSSVSLTAQNCAGTVNWSSGQTGATISVQPTAATTYTATCSVDGRSSGVSNAVLVSVKATPTAPVITGSSTQLVPGSSVTLTAGTTTGTLQWQQSGAAIAGATQSSYVATQAGSL